MIKNLERLISGIKYLLCQLTLLRVKRERNDNHARNFDQIKYQIGKVSFRVTQRLYRKSVKQDYIHH